MAVCSPPGFPPWANGKRTEWRVRVQGRGSRDGSLTSGSTTYTKLFGSVQLLEFTHQFTKTTMTHKATQIRKKREITGRRETPPSQALEMGKNYINAEIHAFPSRTEINQRTHA